MRIRAASRGFYSLRGGILAAPDSGRKTLLKGKTALVTGSTSGIGLAFARALASQGANIVVNGFGERAAIQGAERELQAMGAKTLYHGADMSKPAEIEQMVRAAEQAFGRLDILINNAGIQHVAPVESFPVERWDAIIAINLTSAFHTTRMSARRSTCGTMPPATRPARSPRESPVSP